MFNSVCYIISELLDDQLDGPKIGAATAFELREIAAASATLASHLAENKQATGIRKASKKRGPAISIDLGRCSGRNGHFAHENNRLATQKGVIGRQFCHRDVAPQERSIPPTSAARNSVCGFPLMRRRSRTQIFRRDFYDFIHCENRPRKRRYSVLHKRSKTVETPSIDSNQYAWLRMALAPWSP